MTHICFNNCKTYKLSKINEKLRSLEHDTGILASEMRVAMMNRDVWINVTDRETTIPK